MLFDTDLYAMTTTKINKTNKTNRREVHKMEDSPCALYVGLSELPEYESAPD